MYSVIVNALRFKKETEFKSQTLPLIFLTFESVLISITDISFIFLIIYKKWKKSEDATNFQYHSPIFNQLFYCSAVCLVFINFLFIGAFISDLTTTDDYILSATVLFILIESYTVALFGVFFVSISIFSFLAAIQRIVILYLPSYKCFVMGSFLKRLIALGYAYLIFHIYILIKTDTIVYCISVPSQLELIMLHTSNTALLIISICSGWFYYHLYKIVKNLEIGNANKAKFLLYQFGPIHTVLLIHSSAHVVGSFLNKLSITESFDTTEVYLTLTFLPIIPVVVSLSCLEKANYNYISYRKLRIMKTRISDKNH